MARDRYGKYDITDARLSITATLTVLYMMMFCQYLTFHYSKNIEVTGDEDLISIHYEMWVSQWWDMTIKCFIVRATNFRIYVGDIIIHY